MSGCFDPERTNEKKEASGTADGSFTYSKINSSRKEIRLLILHPGYLKSKPHCDIETVSLNDDPNYTALSWVWSDTSRRTEI